MDETKKILKKRNAFFGEEGLAKLEAIRNNATMGVRQLASFKDKLDDYLGSNLQEEDTQSLNINAHVQLQTDIQLKVLHKMCGGEHFRHPRMNWGGKAKALDGNIIRLFEREIYYGDVSEEEQSTGSKQYGELILEMIEKRVDLQTLLRFIVVASRCTQGLANLPTIIERLKKDYPRKEAGFMLQRLKDLGMVIEKGDAGHIEAVQALKYPTFDDPHQSKDEDEMVKFQQIEWTLLPKLIEEWYTRAGQRALKGYKPGKSGGFWQGIRETRECLRDVGETIEYKDPTPEAEKFQTHLGNVACFVGGVTWEEIAQIRRLAKKEKDAAIANIAALKKTNTRASLREAREHEDLLPTMGWSIITTGILNGREMGELLMHINKVS